jgi:2-methylcitrate dehydratase PrpD
MGAAGSRAALGQHQGDDHVTALVDFITGATPPPAARAAAARAVLDTIGVTLAGASEPAARRVQQVIAADGSGPCRVLGTAMAASATNAALANGTAAHALDFDDMCFVSLAHPSAPLVACALAAAELAGAGGRALLDAYIIGFEIEGRFGRAMNPRHYQKGWHCTSTIGTIGAAAAAARLLGLDAAAVRHALCIAASEASGLKDNFGSMVKPLHAGLAARNGVLAARLAQAGLTANLDAIQGPQGFLAAMDGEHDPKDLQQVLDDLGARWEILDTGITVKLYPSCAATHPALDVLLDLKRQEAFDSDQVQAVEIGVDAVTPTVLIHSRPADGLQAKFSMPFCAAAAIVYGRVGIETFEDWQVRDPAIVSSLQRVTMCVDSTLDAAAPPLTQARVTVRLQDGRVLRASANGARGYPARPAADEELAAKFMSCAIRAMPPSRAEQAFAAVRAIESNEDIRTVTEALWP